jgi:hypothetical protein
MKKFDHDIENIMEACGIDSELLSSFNEKLDIAFEDITEDGFATSKFVEKIENLVKGNPNYLRALVMYFVMFDMINLDEECEICDDCDDCSESIEEKEEKRDISKLN